MRNVYTGRAVAKIEGILENVTETVGDRSHSFAILRVQQCEDNIPGIRHRAVFILEPVDTETHRLLRNQIDSGDSVDAICAGVLSKAELNFASHWEDIDPPVLRLHTAVEQTGDATILIGEYVGNEYKALLVLQQLRSRTFLTLPVYDFFGDHEPEVLHCITSEHPGQARTKAINFFAGKARHAVEQAIDKELSTQQRSMMQRIRSSRGRAVCIQGCPGNGKTLVAMGLLLANISELQEGQCFLWVVNSRKQRDVAVNLFRSLLATDRLSVIGLGDSVKEETREEDAEHCDIAVQQFLESRLRLYKAALHHLRKDINKGFEAILWRHLAERMQEVAVQLRQDYLIAMQELQGRAKIVVMTVDGCVQALTGFSVHSKMLKSYSIRATVIDDCQQVDHSAVTPIVHHTQRFVLLVGNAEQRIAPHRPPSTRSGSSTTPSSGNDTVQSAAFYSWHKAISPPIPTYAWQTLRSEDTHTPICGQPPLWAHPNRMAQGHDRLSHSVACTISG